MGSDFTDFVEHLEKVSPDLVAEFEAGYTEVTFNTNDNCNRCGAHMGTFTQHARWHKGLSLAMYALGATAKFLIEREDGDGV